MAKTLELTAESEDKLCKVGRALSSKTRINILKLLYYNSFNIGEIAEKLNIPASSAGMHIKILEDANLINTDLRAGNRGSMKLCSRKNDYLKIRLAGNSPQINQIKSFSMPVGAYTNCKIVPTCGLACEDSHIIYEDRPQDFYFPERLKAQLLWSSGGFVEYKFPYPINNDKNLKRIMLSFEACSEAPNFREDWKSDISIWINNIECATWRSPGDFGNRRGKNNPKWWENGNTQYGLLTKIEIDNKGTYLNSEYINDVSLKNLSLENEAYILVKIGNKEDAEYIGGFNIFGKKYGDYQQDIILSLVY